MSASAEPFLCNMHEDLITALKDAQNPGLAREWVDLVVSDEGQRVLEKWGFEPAAG